MRTFEPRGISFFDMASNREMLLVDEGQAYAGWICYRHPDGQWVTLRKATEEDRVKIPRAFREARFSLPSNCYPRREITIPLAPTHELKTDPEMFQAVVDRKKTAELRYDDRGYQVGNRLLLRETGFSAAQMAAGSPLQYTGRELVVEITHIVRSPAYGLRAGWCMLSICGEVGGAG